MLKSLHRIKNGYIFVPTNKLKHNTMTNSSKLIKKLNSLKEIFNLGMITEQEYKIRFAKWEQEYKELFR